MKYTLTPCDGLPERASCIKAYTEAIEAFRASGEAVMMVDVPCVPAGTLYAALRSRLKIDKSIRVRRRGDKVYLCREQR